MNILLVANYEPDGQESMQRFSSLMAEELGRLGHNVRVTRPKPVLGKLAAARQGFGKWFGYVDKFLIYPSALTKDREWADIVHVCDHANAMYASQLRGKPHVVTCHDVIAIRSALGMESGHRTRWTGRQLQRMILGGLNKSLRVVSVSEATRSQLLALSGLRPDQVTVIYNGPNYPYSPMARQESDKRLASLGVPMNSGFVMHIGSNEWNKNRIGVLQAFLEYRRRNTNSSVSLVMVGKPWTETMRSFVMNSGLSEEAHELVAVSNEDLRALYSQARLLVFPSFCEGFGWPIIEANACGCPALTANRAPMTEVGGTSAVYVNPEDPQSIAAGMEEALSREEQLRKQAIVNAQRFSTQEMTKAYVELYRKTLDRFQQSDSQSSLAAFA